MTKSEARWLAALGGFVTALLVANVEAWVRVVWVLAGGR